MLRMLLAMLGILLLSIGAWVFLRGESVREVATAPERAAVELTDSAEIPELETLPTESSRETAVEELALAPAMPEVATPAPLTGVLAGRLVIDGGPLSEATLLTLRPDGVLREHAQAPVVIETDAIGRFRREGLSAEWAGVLWLSPPYRLPGESEVRWLAVRLEAPDESLVIEVARDPCLRGRLTHVRSELAAQTNVDVQLYSPRGGYSQTSTQTDASGRFLFVLDDLDFPKVLVEATARDGGTCSMLRERESLAFDAATGDYDLGEIPLHGGFEAHVRVLDPDRAPVAGAQILLRGASPRLPAKSDTGGEARFPVPDSATDMRIAARGFAFESFPVPAGTERIDVVLRRTNRLRVAVLDEHGEPWVGGDVRLRSDGELYASGERHPPRQLIHGGQKSGRNGNVDALGLFHLLVTADDGAIEVQDLSQGVALTVEAVDALQRAWVEARVEGLGPEEQRELTLRIPPVGPRVRGRCTDVAGAPVANARVILQVDDSLEEVGCEPDGSFTGPELAPGDIHVYAGATGFVMTEKVLVDPARGAVMLTLGRGRRVQVELRDAGGREVQVGELRLRDPNSDRVWPGSVPRAAEHIFHDVPTASLEVEFEWFSRRTTARVDADQERVTLTVDVLGSLVIAVDPSIPEPEEWLNLRLTALDGPAAGAELVTYTPTLTGPASVERTRNIELWPGRYEVQLLEFRYDARRRPLPAVPYLHPVHVEVRAGEETRVTLGDEG